MSVLRFIKNSTYALKQRYGLPIALHSIDEHSVDPTTGRKTVTLRIIHIDKALVLRAREFRSFVYDLAYISANKDFTTGGYFDPEDRRVVIDADDLGGYVPKIWDFIIFQDAEYAIKEIQHYEEDYAYGLLVRKIRGQDVIFSRPSHSGLVVTDSVSYEVVDRLTRDVVSILDLTETLTEVP